MASFLKSLFGGKDDNNSEKTNQKNFDILRIDGLRALRMGKTPYAIKCFTEAIKLKEEAEVMNYLNQIYIQSDELDKSIDLLKRMIELFPDQIENYLMLAQVYFMEVRYSDMEAIAQKGTEVDKESAPAYYLLGKAQYSLKNDIMAIAQLTKAITLKVNYTEALLLRAEILLKMMQLKEASKDLETILGYDPYEEAALLLKGKLKEAEGNQEEAEQLYRSVIEQNPFHEQSFVQLGQLYIAQDKPAEAITLFDDAIELNPNCIEAYHERGRAKLMTGDKEGSASDMTKAMELKGDEANALNGTFSNQAEQQGPKDIWQM